MEKYEIVAKRTLAERVNEYVVYAPDVAKHCRAGQFVILRVDEDGERVPFTVCDYSREKGTVCILVQEVGYTTALLARCEVGYRLADFVGPLGNPTDLSEYKDILLVGGGIGSAVIYPQANSLPQKADPRTSSSAHATSRSSFTRRSSARLRVTSTSLPTTGRADGKGS